MPHPPVRLLIVEDEPVVQAFLADLLEEIGFACTLAASSAEALRHLAATADDWAAMIIDAGLPDISGIVLARQIRAQQPRLPIVLVSGFTDAEMMQAAMELAPATLLPKPFDPAGLKEALEAAGLVTGLAETPANRGKPAKG